MFDTPPSLASDGKVSGNISFDIPAPVQQKDVKAAFDRLIEEHTRKGVSDIILRENCFQILERRVLHVYPLPEVIRGQFDVAVAAFFPSRQPNQTTGAIDDTILVGEQRYRASFGRNFDGRELVLRPLPMSIPTTRDLLIDDQIVERFVTVKDGIIIVAGATGQGKSTTIASMIVERARRQSERFLTLEDPIEYVYPAFSRSSFSQKQQGVHFATMSQGLKQALRMAPSVIVVQEIRDMETLEVALNAANTGHLVVATIHASDTVSVFNRIEGLLKDLGDGEGVESMMATVSEAMRTVICQRLEKGDDGSLVAIHEVMHNRSDISNMIRKRDYRQLRNMLEHARGDGMQTFEMAVLDRVQEGLLPGDIIRSGRYRVA